MEKNRVIKLISLILVIVIIAISTVCFATEQGIMPISESEGNPISEEGEVSVPDDEEIEEIDRSEWVNSDAYLFDDDIVVNRIVDGNVFAMGQTVTITEEVGGDVFVFADKVIIDGGYIYSSIFAVANEIEINGLVYDLYASAKTITIGEKGIINRDMKATADTINIDGKIGRDVYLNVRELNISEQSIIQGNLEYTSSTEASIPEEVVGKEIKYKPEAITTTQSVQSTILSYIGDLAKALIYALVVILLALWLAPKFTEKIKKVTGTDIAISLGIGLIACIVTGIVSLILLFTVLGIPLMCTFMVMLFLLLSISKAIVAMSISGIITNKAKIEGKMKFVLIALLIVFAIWAIGEIPYFSIGGIFKIIVGIIGVGLVLTNIVNKKSKEIVNENK